MNTELNALLYHVIFAGVLGLTVWVVQRWIRNPAVRHALWVLVLLKLVTPPLWNPELNWLPPVELGGRATVASEPAGGETRVVTTPPVPPGPTTPVPLSPAVLLTEEPLADVHTTTADAPVTAQRLPMHVEVGAIPVERESPALPSERPRHWKEFLAAIQFLEATLAVWGLGTLVWLVVAGVRILQFQRCLRYAGEAEFEVQQQARALAAQIGLRNAPRVWLVPGKISPMLWAFGGPARLIVPSALFAELDDEARDALLLHELAHYRRGDHWVRYLELAAMGIWWWNPLVWLARRELRIAEEQACDAWVVSQRPESRRAYAEMIVRTLGFISNETPPSLASGIGTPNTVEGRLTQIMRGAATAGVSWQGKAILLIAVLAVLAQSPTLVQAQKADEKTPPATVPIAPPVAAAPQLDKPQATEEVVTVTNEAGGPVSGIDVIAASLDERVKTPLRTDAQGQIRVPREWISARGSYGSSCLIVRDGDARIGWLDLYRVATKRQLVPPPEWVTQPLRIVLLPCTETVTGIMTDPTDRPLPGVRIVATWILHTANQGLGPGFAREEHLASCTTDKDGSYRLRVPAQASVRIEPQHPDWQRRWFAATADQLSLGRRALVPAGRIEGRVVELATGLPRAGDKVIVRRRDDNRKQVDHQVVNYGVGRTLRDGTFVIGSLPPGQYDALYIGPQALSQPHGILTDYAQHKIEVTATKPARADFRLRPGLAFSGVVMDVLSGTPLADVDVSNEGPGSPQSIRTGPDGKFNFRVLPGENRVYLTDRRPPRPGEENFADVKVQVPTDGNIDPIILRTHSANPLLHGSVFVRSDKAPRETSVELIVTVLDLEKRAVAGLDVAAYVQGVRSDPPRRTDDRGQIRIPLEWYSSNHQTAACLVVRDGETRIGWLELQPLAVMRNARPRPADADAPLQIQLLPRDQPVTGILTDKDDKPLAGIPVVISSCWYPKGLGFSLNQYSLGEDPIGVARTDQEGRFRLQFPAGLGGSIMPAHPDWLRKTILVKADKLDVGRRHLTPAAKVEGTVVDAVTGKPRANEWVTARLQKPKQPLSRSTDFATAFGRARTDDAGKFLIGGLTPGNFDIEYVGRDAKVPIGPVGSITFAETMTAKAVEGVRLIAGKTARADFHVKPGVRLAGKVLDAVTKKPLQGVVVGWFDASHPQTAGHRVVPTDAHGKFAFHVHPGVCEIFVNGLPSETQPEARRKLLVAPNQEIPEIVLSATVDKPTFGIEAPPAPAKHVRRPLGRPREPNLGLLLPVRLNPPAGRTVTKVIVRSVAVGVQYAGTTGVRQGAEFTMPYHPDSIGRSHFLLIDAEGFNGVQSPQFVVSKTMPELTIKLTSETFVPVRGRVVNRDKQPVAGARVRVARRIFGHEIEFPWGVDGETDQQGRFEIAHCRLDDTIRLTIDSPGTGGAESRWLTLKEGTPLTHPDLVVGSPDLELGGVVTDFQNNPVVGARVYPQWQSKRAVLTDSKGRFKLGPVSAGEVSIMIESEGFPPDPRTGRGGNLNQRYWVERVSEADRLAYRVPIFLQRGDQRKNTPYTYHLCLEGGRKLGSGNGYGDAINLTDLAEYVKGTPDQKFSLIVIAEDYAQPAPVTISLRRNRLPLTIDLEPAAPIKLRGRVVDEQGRPRAGVAVGRALWLTAMAAHEPCLAPFGKDKPEVTDADGKFEIAGILRNSRVSVLVGGPGYSSERSAWLTADTANDLVLPDIRLLRATSEISGRVFDRTGKLVRDAKVFFDELGEVNVKTDDQGRFVFKQAPQHKFHLRAQAEQGDWNGDVQPGTKDLEIRLWVFP